MRESQQEVDSIKLSNQKVNFSELVIIEEVQRNVSLVEAENEAVSWDDLDSSDEEEETIDETSD